MNKEPAVSGFAASEWRPYLDTPVAERKAATGTRKETTPGKINMEPENGPFGRLLSSTTQWFSGSMSMLIFQGVCLVHYVANLRCSAAK